MGLRRNPRVSEVSWPMAGLQVGLLFGGVVAVSEWTGDRTAGALWGAGGYLLYSRLSKAIALRSHRRGMREMRAGRYEVAIGHFEESYAFLSKHPWIDRFRGVVLLCASRIAYREMALNNIAFCHVLLERLDEAKLGYERLLREFPDSPFPAPALILLRGSEGVDAGTSAQGAPGAELESRAPTSE